MQSEESEETLVCPGTPSSDKMTYSKVNSLLTAENLSKTEPE